MKRDAVRAAQDNGARKAPDFETFFSGGSLWTVQPMTADAATFLRLETSAESTFNGTAVVVEHRFIGAFLRSLTDAGYRVKPKRIEKWKLAKLR